MKTKTKYNMAIFVVLIIFITLAVVQVISTYNMQSEIKSQINADTVTTLNLLTYDIAESAIETNGVLPEKYSKIVDEEVYKKMDRCAYIWKGKNYTKKDITLHGFQTTVDGNHAKTTYGCNISVLIDGDSEKEEFVTSGGEIFWKYEDGKWVIIKPEEA